MSSGTLVGMHLKPARSEAPAECRAMYSGDAKAANCKLACWVLCHLLCVALHPKDLNKAASRFAGTSAGSILSYFVRRMRAYWQQQVIVHLVHEICTSIMLTAEFVVVDKAKGMEQRCEAPRCRQIHLHPAGVIPVDDAKPDCLLGHGLSIQEPVNVTVQHLEQCPECRKAKGYTRFKCKNLPKAQQLAFKDSEFWNC